MRHDWWLDGVLLLILIPLIYIIYQLWVSRSPAFATSGTVDKGSFTSGKQGSWIFPRKMIRHAGYNPEQIYGFYWAIKVVGAVLIPLLALEFMGSSLAGWELAILSVATFFLVDVVLLYKMRIRKYQVQRSVSLFSDLLVAFLNSGMSLMQAFDRAARFGLPHSSPLSRELKLIVKELEMGLSWQIAFEKLAARTGVQELRHFAMIMKVGHNTGVPIVTSLNNHAMLLREKRKESVNAALNRKSVEALIPTLLLSVPMFLVLVFFPTGVQIYDAFQIFTSSW